MARLGPTAADLGTDSNHHIESIHLFIKVGRDCRPNSNPCALSVVPIALWPQYYSFFITRLLPPFTLLLGSQFARLQPGLHLYNTRLSHTLCRVILAGASCKSFLESQPAPRQGTAVEKSCRDPLLRSRPFPQATHHPRFNRLSTFGPLFTRRPYDPAAGKHPQLCSHRELGRLLFVWLETCCHAVKPSSCRRAAGTVPQESPRAERRYGRSVLVQHHPPGPVRSTGHAHRIPVVDT